jgi:hypothetical protein
MLKASGGLDVDDESVLPLLIVPRKNHNNIFKTGKIGV